MLKIKYYDGSVDFIEAKELNDFLKKNPNVGSILETKWEDVYLIEELSPKQNKAIIEYFKN